MSVAELVTVIGAVTAGVTSAINLIGRYWGTRRIVDKLDEAASDRKEVKKSLEETNTKVDTVHSISNGRLTAALARVQELEAMNKVLVAQIERRANPPRSRRRK